MDCDSDIPDSGAAFTFGRSRFSDNRPGKFWIRDDPILQVACGDEHTAILTASGRVFTFGSNEWGQLGHGHTNALTKPSCVKGLRHERATIIACGRSHTLVATDTGHVYGFGANSEGQLGSPGMYTIHSAPVRVQGLEGVTIKSLSGGADHSMALTDKGIVYIWGSGSEGQLGLDKVQSILPTELKLEKSVLCISAGYYHSAFVTVDGSLYTCGESDGGKLGISDINAKNYNTPHLVSSIRARVVFVSCGGNHTIALTADGKAYCFGSGFNGQLGLGDRILETYTPYFIKFLDKYKVARVSCGENHSAFLTDSGHLYSCGDRRHGKLGLLDEHSMCCSEFFPSLVERFNDFQVQQVACGGCHMLVLATRLKKQEPIDKVDIACPERKIRLESLKTLPPLKTSPSASLPKKNISSVMRNTNQPKLPSIYKSPVWYVPLERTTNGDQISEDEEDEVLSKFAKRCSLLTDLEERSLRHADSDVDSDDSEVVELNKTHTIMKIDDELSLLRPVIAEASDSELKNSSNSEQLNDATENIECGLKHQNEFKPGDLNADNLYNEDKKGPNKSSKNCLEAKNKSKTMSRSHFYDTEMNMDDKLSRKSKSSSITSKSSKTCNVL